ncbi:MAG: Ig-like domain-containing protein [Gaiellaceae bacterium]
MRRRIGLSAAIVLAAGLAAAFTPAPASPAPLSDKLVPAQGALFGIFSGQGRYGRTSYQEMLYLEALVGRGFDIDHQYYRWDKPFPSTHDREAINMGRIPALAWAAYRQDDSPVRWASIANGAYDSLIRARADAVKALGAKVMFTFHVEPEDDKLLGTSAEYRAAWRRVVSIFRGRGATNVVWVWNPMTYTFDPWANRNPADWYPGDDVVDWMAADGYNWFGSNHNQDQRWRSFADIFRNFYSWGSARGKPLAVFEFGVLEDTRTPDPQRKAQWFREAQATVKNWPKLKAVMYFNSWSWDFESSVPSLNAFRTWANDPYFNPRATTLSNDTTAPVVTVTSPLDGGQVAYNSAVEIAAIATDNTGVAKVEFRVNGTLRCTDTSPLYTCIWWVWTKTGTNNVIQVTAYDKAGNRASDTVTVTTN